MLNERLDNIYDFISVGEANTTQIRDIVTNNPVKFLIYNTDLQALVFWDGASLREVLMQSIA